MQHLELEVGESFQIDSITVTILEVQGDEICIKICDENRMLPISLSDMIPRLPK